MDRFCHQTDSRYRVPRPGRSGHSTHGRDGCRQKQTLRERRRRCLVFRSPWLPERAGLRPNARHRSGTGVRTRERGTGKARESELGGAASKVCSQTRRRLGRSKPSRTTLRPALVSCGITGRSLFCAVKSSPMGASAGAQFAACSSSCSRFEPASRAYPSGPVARHPQPRGRKPALRLEILWILRGFQGRLSC